MMKSNTKVEQLLKTMTLEEKLCQMQMFYPSHNFLNGCKFSKEKADEILTENGIGCVYIPINSDLDRSQLADFVSDLQTYLKESTRSKIPAIIVCESLHGVLFPSMTVYPQSIGLSCSWNEELVEKIAEQISLEAESVGITQVLAPDLDLVRDARWGRVEETYGEDPYLTGKLGACYTRGIRKREKIIATLKHFVAHGEPENGINLSPISIGERKLRELYLPVFEESLKENPLSVMPAYHEFDGKPCHASKKLLTELLRNELGFDGYTISDFSAIKMLYGFQHTATDAQDAGRQALLAGVDLEAANPFGFGSNLQSALESGKIDEADIDRAVKRILSVKEKIGLLDEDYRPSCVMVDMEEHKKLALEAAEESIVLLKNNGILPLTDRVEKIAVIGPNGDVMRLGDYAPPANGATLFHALKDAFDGEVKHCDGCSLLFDIEGGIEEAVTIAQEADIVILALGGNDMMSGVGWGDETQKNEVTCGEGFDSHDLRLPPAQMKLAESVLNVGKPVVLLLQDGRPCAIPDVYDRCDAIVQAWYAGQEGGIAMANIILGKVNPSGKLTMSIPKHVGQLPLFYNYKPSARGRFYQSFGSSEHPGRSYTLLDPWPYFEFGFGLSYTEFKYDNLRVDISECTEITVSVDVKNIGKMSGKEIVQLYINDLVSSVTTPVKALKGFKKISVEPGETKTVVFKIGFNELYLIDDEMKKVVEEGCFEITIADLKTQFYLSEIQCKSLSKY